MASAYRKEIAWISPVLRAFLLCYVPPFCTASTHVIGLWVPSLRAHVSLFVCSSLCSHHSRHSYARKSDLPSCLLSLPLGLFLSHQVEY